MSQSRALSAILVFVLSAANAIAGERTAVRVGHLLDVAQQKVRHDVVLLVEDGRFREIVDSVPNDTVVLDLTEYWVVPGLIDGHTHVLLQGDATAAEYEEQILKESNAYRALRATRAMRIALEHGFTTLRELDGLPVAIVPVSSSRWLT